MITVRLLPVDFDGRVPYPPLMFVSFGTNRLGPIFTPPCFPFGPALAQLRTATPLAASADGIDPAASGALEPVTLALPAPVVIGHRSALHQLARSTGANSISKSCSEHRASSYPPKGGLNNWRGMFAGVAPVMKNNWRELARTGAKFHCINHRRAVNSCRIHRTCASCPCGPFRRGIRPPSRPGPSS